MQTPFGLPEDCCKFLKRNGGKKKTISFLGDVRRVVFFEPDELAEDFTLLNTCDYHMNHGEFEEDPDWTYWFPSIDLIKEECSDTYGPEGLLVWFPLLNCFGTADSGHQSIYLFPETPWKSIKKNLGKYVNAQWYPEKVDPTLFMPWKDQGFGAGFEKFIRQEA